MVAIIQNIIDAVSLGSLYALSALGVGLIFGILRLINFAHGDFITIGAYTLIVPAATVTATLLIGGWHPVPMVISVVAIVVVIALISERAVFRQLRDAGPATLLIGSFALSFFLQHLILMIYGSRPKGVGVGEALNQQLNVGDLRIPLLNVVTIVVTIVLLTALAVFMQRTRYGAHMRAAAEDFRMARLLGVRANRVIAVAFAISGLLAATVALLLIIQSGQLTYRMGVQIVLIAFVATVIGGMGSLVGAALGGFLVGVMSVLMQVILPEGLREGRDAFVFIMVILILLLRPQGLIRVGTATERI